MTTHDENFSDFQDRLSDEHVSVLAETLVRQISLPRDGVMVDATMGHGGHSLLLGSQLGQAGTILGFDVDKKCIEKARQVTEELSCRVIQVRANFSCLAEKIKEYQLGKVDLILADLGFCSAQMADPKKGLSFQFNAPLDMRLDDTLKTTAADLIRDLSETQLADIIYKYGQDRASRRIARFLVQHRRREPIRTTGQLAAIVAKALGQNQWSRKSRIHPATRTFQALRIAVNGELDVLEKLLADAPDVLKPGGRIAIISFHSLEDRIVKLNFRENHKNGVYEVLTKKPLVATAQEVEQNPRSRSAKLRIAKKL